ncbi:hypothetical protein TNCV_2136451 [Trichonephila clavipes]|nr:hypothetical protein TNCV_2136451 [Trichonephila clavipes]
MNKVRNTPVEVSEVSVFLDCPTVSSEEFLAVHEDIMYYSAPMMADKDIFEFVQSSNILLMQIPTTKMKLIMQILYFHAIRHHEKYRSNLDAHSNSEMNNKMDDIEKFAIQGLVTTDLVILNHDQATRTTPDLAPVSPNFHTTPWEDV